MWPKRMYALAACLVFLQACGPESPQTQTASPPQVEELSSRDSSAEFDKTISRSLVEGRKRVSVEIIELCVRLEHAVHVPDARVELLPDGTLVHDGTMLAQPSTATTRQFVDALENLLDANRTHSNRPGLLEAFVSPTNNLDKVWPLLRAPGFARKVRWSTVLRGIDAHAVVLRPAMHDWPGGPREVIGLKVLHEPSNYYSSDPAAPRTVFDLGPSTRFSWVRLEELLGLISQGRDEPLMAFVEFGPHSTARDLLTVCSMLLEAGNRDVSFQFRRAPVQRRHLASRSGVENAWIPREQIYALGKTRLEQDVRDPEQRALFVPSLEWSHADQAWLFSARDDSDALGDRARRYLIDPRDGAISKPSY